MSKPTAEDFGRICQSCGATKTPVWRTGPTGPKTMCNRCGIKWMRKNPAADRSSSPVGSNISGRKRSNSVTSPRGEVPEPSSSPESMKKYFSKRNTETAEDDDGFSSLDEEYEEDHLDSSPRLKSKSPKTKRSGSVTDSLESSNSFVPYLVKDFSSALVSHITKSNSHTTMSDVKSVSAGSNDSTAMDIEITSPHISSSMSREVEALSLSSVPDDENSNTSPRFQQPQVLQRPPIYTHFIKNVASSESAFKVFAPQMQKSNLEANVIAAAASTQNARGATLPWHQIEAKINDFFSSAQQYLDLSGQFHLDANSIRSLPCNLQNLNLSNCKQLTDSDLLFLPPQLQSLNLSACNRITDETMKHLPHSLRTLNVSNCYNITDEGLKSLPMTLTSLDISMCYKITDEGTIGLPPLLSHLNAEGCKITNETLKLLPSSVRYLNVQSCEGITNEGIVSLPSNLSELYLGYTKVTSCESLQHLHSMKTLDLMHCDVADSSIQCLPRGLESLVLFHCPKITKAILRMLPPSLEFLNVKSTSVGVVDIGIISSSSHLKVYI